MDLFDVCAQKMRNSEMSEVSVKQFERLYRTWQEGNNGQIPESEVEPLTNLPKLVRIENQAERKEALKAFEKTAFLKLNGGLGTSMGLDGPKSLLPVRRHKAIQRSFLDIILGQLTTVRERQNVRLPLTLMNSFSTSKQTLNKIREKRNFKQDGVPLEIMQHIEPKIDCKTGKPAEYKADPKLEWCPPGHGDVFSTMWESNLLDILLEQGFEFLFISNSDNLGARPSSTAAGAFAQSGSSFMLEAARRTKADRKGGHIVKNAKTSSLLLREMSQVSSEDMDSACDIERHPFFNTNNIWVRIKDLRDLLEKNGGILPLPVILNEKNVNPADSSTEKVIQLETAMGAAASLFDNASCIEVSRARFLPVKTTNDLLIMRSDRFHLTDAYEMEDGDYNLPHIDLDSRFYKNISDFEERFPYGVPSLAAARSVDIRGDWTFGQNVKFFANAVLEDEGRASYVPNGSFVGPCGIESDKWM